MVEEGDSGGVAQRPLDSELAMVRSSLLEMAGRVEQMMSDVNRALLDRDSLLAERVIRADREVDENEKQLDAQCSTVLALHETGRLEGRGPFAILTRSGAKLEVELLEEGMIRLSGPARHIFDGVLPDPPG